MNRHIIDICFFPHAFLVLFASELRHGWGWGGGGVYFISVMFEMGLNIV